MEKNDSYYLLSEGTTEMNLTGLWVVGIIALSIFCMLMGLPGMRRRKPPPAPPVAARAICSMCLGHLSGLESYCQHCGRRLVYAVRSQPTVQMEPVVVTRKKK